MRLLPVYIDHILFPTLTKSGFITEIYSVTKDGEDNGAVYCEMQGRENSGESRGHLELLRNIYPDHGYSKVRLLRLDFFRVGFERLNFNFTHFGYKVTQLYKILHHFYTARLRIFMEKLRNFVQLL